MKKKLVVGKFPAIKLRYENLVCINEQYIACLTSIYKKFYNIRSTKNVISNLENKAG